MAGEDKPFDLRAAIERAYNEIQQRKGKPRRDPLKPLRHELSNLQDRERFIALCQREWAELDRWKRDAAKAEEDGDTTKTKPRSLVKIWVAEYRTKASAATSGTEAHLSFPLIYLSQVVALAQAQGEGEPDLREETVRRLLGGGTFDDSVAVAALPAHQSWAGSRKRGPGQLKRALDQIRGSYEVQTLGDLLKVLDNGEHMADLYCSTVSPIDITDVQVDHDGRAVHYRARRQSPVEQAKSVSFRRLREVLAGR